LHLSAFCLLPSIDGSNYQNLLLFKEMPVSKIILSAVLFLAFFAVPANAASPAARYEQGLALLQQSDAAVTLALAASSDPFTMDEQTAAGAISQALGAAELAVLFKGKDSHINADTAATLSVYGAMFADLAAAADNETAAAYWAEASSLALQAAVLFDPKLQ
jgi:hypothetical protein